MNASGLRQTDSGRRYSPSTDTSESSSWTFLDTESRLWLHLQRPRLPECRACSHCSPIRPRSLIPRQSFPLRWHREPIHPFASPLPFRSACIFGSICCNFLPLVFSFTSVLNPRCVMQWLRKASALVTDRTRIFMHSYANLHTTTRHAIQENYDTCQIRY